MVKLKNKKTNFQLCFLIWRPRIDLVLANCAEPDFAAFQLGLHCLQKNLLRGFQSTRGSLFALSQTDQAGQNVV